MKNNYDYIAKYYDRLSRIIFNQAQVNAQTEQLDYIPVNSSILIVGGGSGWILDELCNRQPIGLSICYVEASANMLNLARKANTRQNKIRFIHTTIQDFLTEESFDVVITAFLFDNFNPQTAAQVFKKLYHLLRSPGLWLYADFSYSSQKKKLWQRIMMKSMYLFFKLIARLEANTLTEMSVLFKQHHCRLLFQRHYYKGFIESSVYEKPFFQPNFQNNHIDIYKSLMGL